MLKTFCKVVEMFTSSDPEENILQETEREVLNVFITCENANNKYREKG